jgi:hypothetical protein
MTITALPNGLGGTDYFITPPGLGGVGAILTLPKSSAISLAAGARIVPAARTAAGYSGNWATGTAAGLSAIVTTAAAAGTTTVQAQLESFLSIGVTASKLSGQQGQPPSIFGDTVLSTVVKPSSENWPASISGSLIYKYLSGVIFLYTIDLPTARAAQYAVHVGSSSMNAGPGTVVGYIAAARFAAQLSGQINETSKALESIAVPVTGTAPLLGGEIYTNLDRTLVSGVGPTLATPNLLGVVIAHDKRVSPTIYSYAFGNDSPAEVPFEVLCQAFGSAIDSATRVAYSTFFNLIYSRVADGFPNVTDRVYAGVLELPWNTTGNSLDNKSLPDFAYDPILPAPLDVLRVVWSQINSGTSLSPFIVRRSPAVAPIVGMVATGRVKAILERPELASNCFNSFRWASFAHGQAPVGVGVVLTDTGYPTTRPSRVRAGVVSYSRVIINAISGVTTVSAKWGQRNENTGNYSVLPGYPAIAMVQQVPTTRWSCILPPISPTYATAQSIARYVVMLSIDGSPYGYAGGFGSSASLRNLTPVANASPVATISDGLPIYPFDILRACALTDSGGQWVGNRGWRFNALPLPTVTWAAGPVAATLNPTTGVLSIPTFPAISYSVPVGNGVLTAYSGSVSSSTMRLAYYRLQWMEVPADKQPRTLGQSKYLFSNSPVTISGTFKPIAGPLTLRVFMYFTYLNPDEALDPGPEGGVPHPYAFADLVEYHTDIAVP